LGVDKVSRFKHVALSNSEHVAISSWARFTKLSRVCQRLAASCPALHTIIIQRDEREAGKNEALREPLSQDMADLYAAVSEQTGPEIGYEEPCTPHLRALLLEYFGDRPLNLHSTAEICHAFVLMSACRAIRCLLPWNISKRSQSWETPSFRAVLGMTALVQY
jgi:hypothetical protein